MCEYKSFLVTKDLTVYTSDMTDSHDDLFFIYGIKDEINDDGEPKYAARVEIVPDMTKDVSNLNNWKFVVDERVVPSWLSSAHEFACRSVFTRINWSRFNLRGLDEYKFPLPDGLTHTGDLWGLEGYNFPLPDGLTHTGSLLGLDGYKFPLPDGLTHTGNLWGLEGYKFPLPNGLTHTGSLLGLEGYNFPLPDGLTHIGELWGLEGYKFPLPDGLK